MALSTFALVSLAELNSALQETSDGGTQDGRKEQIINRVSDSIEAFTGRKLVTRGTSAKITEYHSPKRYSQEIRLAEYPLIALTSVHEDPDWESKASANWYEAATLLVENTDFIKLAALNEPAIQTRLFRIATDWPLGRRVIKVIYEAGYANTAAVPVAIKDVALDWCKALWWDESRGKSGASSMTDATGTVTRFAPTMLTEARQSALANYRRDDCAPTWERAA